MSPSTQSFKTLIALLSLLLLFIQVHANPVDSNAQKASTSQNSSRGIAANNQGHALAAQGRFAEAELLYQQALPDLDDINDKRIAINRAAVLNNLGVALVQQHRPQEALSVFEEAVSLRQSNLGSDNPFTLLSRHNLAITFLNLGQNQPACKEMRQVAYRRNQVLGTEHADTQLSHNILRQIPHCS